MHFPNHEICNLLTCYQKKKFFSSTYKNVKPKKDSKRKTRNISNRRTKKLKKLEIERVKKTRNGKNRRDSHANLEQTTHQRISQPSKY